MSIIKNNEKRAKKSGCFGCVYLHIGQEVDHNHCDFSRDYWYQKRANGLLKEECMHQEPRYSEKKYETVKGDSRCIKGDRDSTEGRFKRDRRFDSLARDDDEHWGD
jgi:hypothetical protein